MPLINDPRVARPTVIPHPYTRKDGLAYVRIAERRARAGEDLFLVLSDRKSGTLIGGIGLHKIHPRDRRAELGYWVAPRYWRQGYASEAVRGLCEVGFRELKLHRIEAGVFSFNRASQRLLRKVGFRREGRSVETRRDGNRWADTLRFGLLDREFRSRPPKRRALRRRI